ncbi:MAG: EamA family transporter, partial [Ensifer adhaerens]
METWVLITIAAAFLQNVRSAMQKHLKGVMGTTGATFVRFGFGLPFAFLYLVVLWQVVGRPLPVPNGTFFLWAVIGGLAQIAATFLLVHLFSFRNFAVGTAYSRTEPAQAALFGLIFLGEKASEGTLVAIAISVVGVMLISVARTTLSARTLVTSVFSRTAGIGLLSGTFFGLSAVAYRSASLALAPSLPAPDYMMQASFTLGFVILLQTVVMLIWIVLRERDELPRIAAAWKP